MNFPERTTSGQPTASTTPRRMTSRPSNRGRWFRMVLKELRETIRDRRTILTLLLMPVLAYPLLGIIFQRLLLSQVSTLDSPEYLIAFPNDEQSSQFGKLWGSAMESWRRKDRARLAPSHSDQISDGPTANGSSPDTPDTLPTEAIQPANEPVLTSRRAPGGNGTLDVEHLVAIGNIDLGIRFDPVPDGNSSLLSNQIIRLIYVDRSPRSMAAYQYVLDRLDSLNIDYLTSVARSVNRPESVANIQVTRLPAVETTNALLASLVPLVLLLMTMTGAVYPAIDLTAGERERHTLETVIAAPVSRISILLAKYVAVVTVALLTATINVSAMLLTMQAVGLENALFGDQGITLSAILALFGLLAVFATFFSAVVLCITSIARSFKEAQAYLIPLMLLSLAPGVASLIPGIEPGSSAAFVPLLNMVLLARATVLGTATFELTAIVIGTTLIYGMMALALAARWFGTNAVMAGSAGGWNDLFRRPSTIQSFIKPELAFFTLAVIFPAFFITGSRVSRLAGMDITMRLGMNALLTALLFGGWPLLVALWRRVPLATAFQLHRPPVLTIAGAVLAGLSAWPLVHEVVLWLSDLGISAIGQEQISRAKGIIDAWKNVPFSIRLISIGLIPALFEELCFRGFLMGALLPRMKPAMAVLASALAFGFFHILVGGMFAPERMIPSTLLGLVLGTIAVWSGSVWPGILFHVLNNSSVLVIAQYEELLKSRGWDLADQTHLPPVFLISAGLCLTAGLTLVWLGRRQSLLTSSLTPSPVTPAVSR